MSSAASNLPPMPGGAGGQSVGGGEFGPPGPVENEHPAAQDQKFPVVIGVTGGTFYCTHCGARWVGTWRGDPSLMTCRWCDHPMNGADDATE